MASQRSPTKPKWHLLRSRFSSTYPFMTLLLGVAVLANVPGERYLPKNERGYDDLSVDLCDHGWPWPYLHRRHEYWRIPHPPISVWRVFEDVHRFRLSVLLADLGVALASVGLLTWSFERWRASRRLFQFTVAELLVAVVILGFVSSGVGRLVQRAREHQRFVAALRHFDATVSVVPGGVDWLRDIITRADCRVFDRFDTIRIRPPTDPTSSNAQESDYWFSVMADCPTYMRGVRYFSVEGRQEFADRNLGVLRYADNLERLDLCHTNVTDVGMGELNHLKRLNTILLRGTDVSDIGLERLMELPNLKGVDYFDSRISVEAIDRLLGPRWGDRWSEVRGPLP